MRSKKGFSLVELLAVIVLLGLILLIALPSYDKYIDKLAESAYTTNEKQSMISGGIHNG